MAKGEGGELRKAPRLSSCSGHLTSVSVLHPSEADVRNPGFRMEESSSERQHREALGFRPQGAGTLPFALLPAQFNGEGEGKSRELGARSTVLEGLTPGCKRQ